LFVAQTPEAFKYDADGNLTNDGRWSYSWDAENRLTNMTASASVPAAAKLKLDFTYDYRGRRTWKVVGILDSGGSSFESEVWVDARDLANDAKRPIPYSGLRLKLAAGADPDALMRRIEDDPRWALEAKPETEYYAKQAESANTLYGLVVGLAVLAGIGAVFGATNTMYAAVQARIAEIGTLRALGFSRGSVLLAFLIESVAIAGLGLLVGVAVAWPLGLLVSKALGGIGFGAATFSTNVITLRVGAFDVAMAALLAAAIGLAGGLAPAWRAAQLRPVDALRKG